MSQLFLAANQFDKQKIIVACEKTMSNISNSGIIWQEELIRKYMKKRHFFFGRFFTREEAITKLKTQSTWYYTTKLGSIAFNNANKILNMAKAIETPTISLTIDEFNLLH